MSWKKDNPVPFDPGVALERVRGKILDRLQDVMHPDEFDRFIADVERIVSRYGNDVGGGIMKKIGSKQE